MRASLGFRLLLTAAVTTGLALIATAIVLNVQFRSYFEERIRAELDAHLFLVTGSLGTDDAGGFAVAEVPDPRFYQPLSGYYWQIEPDDAPEPLLSPSFWDQPLDLPPAAPPGVIGYHGLSAGSGDPLSIASWVVQTGEGAAARRARVTVALDRADMDRLVTGFFRSSTVWLAAMGAFLLLASWVQVRIGLRPLEKVRFEVDRIARAPNERLGDDYPSEVLPLVAGLNRMLDANAAAVDRARAQAGNLAHGLKTPLTVLQGVAARLRRAGRTDEAQATETEIGAIEHIVERELARTRDSHQTGGRCTIAPIARRLADVLADQPGSDHIEWTVEVPESLAAPFDEFDLTELLGNLLDNAMKWTTDRIAVRAVEAPGRGSLSVEDNGAGIEPADIGTAVARGGRLDAARPGTGLGLSIVADMAQSHGCALDFTRSALGGLRVSLSWPLRDAPR